MHWDLSPGKKCSWHSSGPTYNTLPWAVHTHTHRNARAAPEIWIGLLRACRAYRLVAACCTDAKETSSCLLAVCKSSRSSCGPQQNGTGLQEMFHKWRQQTLFVSLQVLSVSSAISWPVKDLYNQTNWQQIFTLRIRYRWCYENLFVAFLKPLLARKIANGLLVHRKKNLIIITNKQKKKTPW